MWNHRNRSHVERATVFFRRVRISPSQGADLVHERSVRPSGSSRTSACLGRTAARLPITRHDPMPARARVDLNAVYGMSSIVASMSRNASLRPGHGGALRPLPTSRTTSPRRRDWSRSSARSHEDHKPHLLAHHMHPAIWAGPAHAPEGSMSAQRDFFLLVILGLMAAAPVQGQSRPTGSDRIRPPSNYRAQRCERVYGPSFRERLKYRRSGGG
jgi:hypothetical protein